MASEIVWPDPIEITERQPEVGEAIIAYGEGLDAKDWWGGVWYGPRDGDPVGAGFNPDAGYVDGPHVISHWLPMPPKP